MADQRLTHGVSVAAVRRFLGDLKREFPDTYTEMTTEDACKQLVVPRTRQDNCAYVEQLRKQSPEHVNKATVFVSHAWRYKIADVLNVLLEFAQQQARKDDGQPVFFWFDLFMNNQNANVTANLPQEWWSTTFKQSIANIGHVLLVLMPWRDPVPLTRAWCLWEIFCGISNEGTEVTIQLPNSEEQALENAIRSSYKAVTDTLVRVQAQRADAFNPHDKHMIFTAIESWAGGFSAVNQAVKDQLRAWCLQKAVAAVEAMRARGEDSTDAFAGLCLNVGAVLSDFGEHDRAIAYFETALPIYLRTEGEKGEGVAALYNNLGLAYDNKGKYDKAIEFYEKALAITVEALGEKHPSTATSYNNLGNAYADKGEYDRAIAYVEKALAITVETVGEKHPSTASTYGNLGNAYDSKGDHDKAVHFYEKALAIKVETLGEKHPSTAQTYNNLGIAYDHKGDLDKAVEFYEQGLAIKVETLGEKHPSTASTYNNLGLAFKNKGHYDKAVEFYEQARAVYVEALGEKHPYTAMTLANIGLLHDKRGEKEQACAYTQQALDAFTTTLGPDHPNTRKAKGYLLRICGNDERDDGGARTAARGEDDDEQQQGGSEQVQAVAGQQDAADEDELQERSPQQPLAGWLQKRGQWNIAFRTRWCTLGDDHLTYSKGPSLAERGRIPLSSVLSAELAHGGEELHVAVPGRTFVFRLDARSDTSLADWCTAINSRINVTT
ncbi:TPR repeat-containing protein, variant [Salpingoeca rosetta]|uniref:TPR repeat-containing protein, variant n=1 Tax=Salpingoeca rosetta (strain ATCC 50818 / BSB-021) TaxID=946362 RepID=F2ULX9_SALR5|nr:TPR repeat-containing protein, variant [Salpingoeca rosetta]EGD78128.1 TPR repeat-containing protein, variant [Salpingoeca rosetta]|eukprot:XP_004989804.1 TPR repeat-containing protein, variant [Salpingoeca rosetta]